MESMVKAVVGVQRRDCLLQSGAIMCFLEAVDIIWVVKDQLDINNPERRKGRLCWGDILYAE